MLYGALFNVSDLFAELCTLLCGCGHYEKAVALFQAQLDFTLFRPAVLGPGSTHKDAVDFMSVYWDSNAPKFGEDGFQGWAAWVESGGQQAAGQFWYSKGTYVTHIRGSCHVTSRPRPTRQPITAQVTPTH